MKKESNIKDENESRNECDIKLIGINGSKRPKLL